MRGTFVPRTSTGAKGKGKGNCLFSKMGIELKCKEILPPRATTNCFTSAPIENIFAVVS
jgi:hypothetical protein